MYTAKDEWYFIDNPEQADSPALLVYPERVKENIRRLTNSIADIKRLRPHVKTHKTKEVSRLCMEAGIRKFKCATIAEAEMLAREGAKDVLLAYQPVGPKAERFISLLKKYPVSFSCLTDNLASLKALGRIAEREKKRASVYVDINAGMDRTGIRPGQEAMELYEAGLNTPGIEMKGLHVYDGHIRNPDMAERTSECNKAFAPVEEIQRALIEKGYPKPVLVAGGSPTFPIHAQREEVECSPGTFVYWDKGYLDALQEQAYLPAALVLSRIISLPAPDKICVDTGYKSVASENEPGKRIQFLNAPDLKVSGHSEEHLVLKAPEGHHYQVGDILYGLPFHICPTCALYEKALVVENRKISDEWKITARDRTIEV